MSNKVIVLQDGYSRWHIKPYSMLANGTSTLIRLNNGQNIIVDTLGPWDRDNLIKLLQNNHMTTDDISMVIGTHLHTDHIGNLNLFPNASQIVCDQRSSGDYFEFDIFHGQRSLQLIENNVEL
ncbi:metallo-beta-lactamase domain-containing protein 1-like protein, partial [Euroglyphus maynei]